MKRCCIGIFLLGCLAAKAQTITSYAGCVSMLCSGIGDGHPATAANLDDPAQGVFDKYANYYLAEPLGARIRKINLEGIITTVAGGGSSSADGIPATSALMSEPDAVIVDTIGNFYISDVGSDRIRKVDITTGIITTIVGNGTSGFYGDGMPATSAEISGVESICFDKFGNLYIVDGDNYRVRKVNTSGIISTFAGTGGTSLTGTGDGSPATAATFAIITGVAADDTGNIYIADLNAGKVRKVNTLGIISTFAGNGTIAYAGDGISANAAQMAPETLVFDSMENLIITDRYNERVYKITTDGIFHCIAGIGGSGTISGDGGPATAASLDPGGASFDPCWNLYIPDIDNDRVREIHYNPLCNLDSIALHTNRISQSPEISIYPNPTYAELNIDNLKNPYTYCLVSIVGAVMQQGTLKEGNNSIFIQAIPNGLYMLEVIDDKEQRIVYKIIKQ